MANGSIQYLLEGRMLAEHMLIFMLEQVNGNVGRFPEGKKKQQHCVTQLKDIIFLGYVKKTICKGGSAIFI